MKREINLSHKLKTCALKINHGQHEREMAGPGKNIVASMWWGNGTVTSLLIQNYRCSAIRTIGHEASCEMQKLALPFYLM